MMSPKALVNSSSVVLVSGGARGITARCVVRLAERSRCKFILLGRTPIDEDLPDVPVSVVSESDLKRWLAGHLQAQGQKPLPSAVQKMARAIQARREVEGTLRAVEEAGGQAEYVAVDVTDGDAVQEKLAGPVQRLGKVTGIIHGAGTLADKLIEKKSVKDFDTVVSPKVDGLESMLKVIPPAQLDFLVLFSSIVGFYGNVGQSDYAIANEILNKSAYMIKRMNPDCRVISINWGPWDGGMVTPELKKMFQDRHVEIIPIEVGASILVDELSPSNDEVVQMVVGTPPARPAGELDDILRTFQIRRRLDLESNPFLFDHMIGEHPVLPATCAATWAVSVSEQLYPGFEFHALDSFKVLKGIVFDENLADEHTLELKEVEKDSSGKVVFDAVISSKNKNGRTIFHYSLRVTLMRTLPEAPVLAPPLPLLSQTEKPISGEQLYSDGTLFHGPSFQGVQQVLHISRGRMVVETMLPKVHEKYQGQFPVHNSNPFIYDAIVQTILIWSQYFYQAPCLPSRLDRLEQYRPIPFDHPAIVTMEVVSQSETSVVADLLVQDLDGTVLVRFTHLEGTISPILNRLIGRKN